MKIAKYVLGVALGLIGLMGPSEVRADIVDVTISNLTFNGNSACGPPPSNVLCTQTLNVTFQWDNTTNAFVAGSLSFSTSGALGTSFVTRSGPGLGGFVGFPAVGVDFVSGTNGVDVLAVSLGATSNGLPLGVYNMVGSSFNMPPGSWVAQLECGESPNALGTFVPTTPCGQTLFPQIPFSFFGAYASSGVVTVSAVSAPEPSSLLLLGSGLLGLMAMGWRGGFRKHGST